MLFLSEQACPDYQLNMDWRYIIIVMLHVCLLITLLAHSFEIGIGSDVLAHGALYDTNCPAQCRCFQGNRVDCSRSNLTSFPADIPPATKYL